MRQVVGLLAMNYGTPGSTEEILPYYTHIRRGRPPEPQQLQELTDRYEAIGGLSPLRQISAEQGEGILRYLQEMDPEKEYRLYTGCKHAHPMIEEAIAKMEQDGIKQAIAFVLAPHFSSMSVGAYIDYAKEALRKLNSKMNMVFLESWHLEPDFITSVAKRTQLALEQLPDHLRQDAPVFFTAHSLPERILEMGDPYPEQIRATGAAVAKEVGIKNWSTGWQSAGRTKEPWLGPDILDIIREQHEKGVQALVICPVGFVSDHLEVLYDIDIEAKSLAAELGIILVRPESPNAEPLFLRGIAKAVLRKWQKSGHDHDE